MALGVRSALLRIVQEVSSPPGNRKPGTCKNGLTIFLQLLFPDSPPSQDLSTPFSQYTVDRITSPISISQSFPPHGFAETT